MNEVERQIILAFSTHLFNNQLYKYEFTISLFD